MKTFEGNLTGGAMRIAIVAARFNAFIVSELEAGALDSLKRHGVAEDSVEIVRVPGAFEIPLAAQKIAAKPEIDAVVCLGAVIRGSTPHFDYVCAEASKGCAHVSLASGKPVIFGVLTTDSVEQAIDRAGTKSGNKGFDAATTAIEMVNLMRSIG